MTVLAQELSLSSIDPALLWEPVQGSETLSFVAAKKAEGMAQEALANLVFEAQQILGRCSPPTAASSDATGLVVGYVQSGKTMSFTTLTALARDNGFGLVILIAGTLDNLRVQTRDRLKRDLRVDIGSARPWVVVDNPRPGAADALISHLRRWLNPSMPANKRRTVIVVVLKNTSRLRALRECFIGLDMAKVPTLVIDDEADQASLNTAAAKNLLTGANKQSASYKQIVELKQALSHHTYVQYTATPQAPLLVSLDDDLSPQFAETLRPGSAYVGGQILFAPGAGYAKTIPSADAGATAQTHKAPPPSLVAAMLVFLLGACAVEESGEIEVRTMMVHPSQQTALHGDYRRWVADALEEWKSMAADEALLAQLKIRFHAPYDDLHTTVGPQMPGFDDLLAHLPSVLMTTSYREVNSTGTGAGPIDWSTSEYWILVGGSKLDRGYTVEGLSVSYMPRPLGVGNADTLQQRARFYGYKRKYLGYCRVYLLQDVLDAFENYVDHEEAIHESLRKTRGHPLGEWKRQFYLDAAMNPTRAGVIGMPLSEIRAEEWLAPKSAQRTKADAASNSLVFDSFVESLGGLAAAVDPSALDPGRYIDKRGASSKRNGLFEAVPIDRAVDALFSRLRFGDPDDAALHAGIVLTLHRIKELGENFVDVFIIGALEPQTRSKRGESINQVFSGQSPDKTTDLAKLNYGGDRSFQSAGRVSIQLRRFDLRDDKAAAPTELRVPWYAVHVPQALAGRLVFQNG